MPALASVLSAWKHARAFAMAGERMSLGAAEGAARKVDAIAGGLSRARQHFRMG